MTAGKPNMPDLLDRCKSGESEAFRQLYLQYAKAMLNVSVRIVNQRDEAEDILQEAFLKAFQNIRIFEKEHSFASWLKKVIVNRSIDVVRRRKNLVSSIDNLPEETPEEEKESGVEYDIETVKKAVQELPDGYRIVLTLFLFENYSHKEIAGMLNISEGNSKSQYHRAKLKLAGLVKEKMKVNDEQGA